MADRKQARDAQLEKLFIEKANKVIPGSDKGVDIGMSDTDQAGATTTRGEMEFAPGRSDGVGEVGEDTVASAGDIKGEDSDTPTYDTDLPGLTGDPRARP